jgi:nucleoside-diphosphate-sugar epimerase
MRILVTGADGFLGARASDVLEARSHDVLRVVRRAHGPGHTRLVVADLAAPGVDLGPQLRGVDALLHLAARAHVLRERASEAEREFCRVNVELTRSLAQQAVAAGVRRFVFVSTVGVNGSATHTRPFVETDAPRPVSLYGRSKLEAEVELGRVAASSSLEIVNLRPPLVYGPGAKGNMLRLLKLASSGLPLPLGSLRNRRNLLGLDNLCDALALCIESPAAVGETFLIAEPEARSTADLVGALHRALGLRERLVPFPRVLLKGAATVAGKSEAYEKLCGSLELDATKIRRLLGWQPRTSFETGIEQTVRWFQLVKPSLRQ